VCPFAKGGKIGLFGGAGVGKTVPRGTCQRPEKEASSQEDSPGPNDLRDGLKPRRHFSSPSR